MDSTISLAPSKSSPWIPFSERMPEPAYDPANPNTPTHGKILVTNNLESVNRWGNKDHVWLVSMVHYHEKDTFFDKFDRWGIQEQTAFAGEITAFDDRDKSIRFLTHWRPAFPEEWPELREPKSEPKVCVYNEAGGPV